ncbi:MAG: thiamine-phosphate kinase [Rikenellaceae bacterium]|jgi:thiamine-monophosphate kinase|nr:thiamine-phosphate kinase [Rikenellaceae bacterium]
MGEFEFIYKIKELFGGIEGSSSGSFGRRIEGIGDDCAVLPMGDGRAMVVTTDMLLEGSHFLPAAAPARVIGRKSLAVNLSDVAAMGAQPVATLLSIGLPKDCTGEWAEGFIQGYKELSAEHGVALIGGDTTASQNGIAINVVAIGVADETHIKRRSDAQAGDLVCVCGRLGESAAGLRDVLAGRYDTPAALAHHNPAPQVAEGLWLGAQVDVHAMIDLSDGLASDLAHVLRASGVGTEVDLDAIPTDYTLADALAGGEDYKLLFTAASADVVERYRREVGEVYIVGRIVPGEPHIKWLRDGREVAGDWRGFTHF